MIVLPRSLVLAACVWAAVPAHAQANEAAKPAPAASAPQSAFERTVNKVGSAIGTGFRKAGEAIGYGAQRAASGVEYGASKTGEAIRTGADKVGLSSPAASAPAK